MYAYDLYNDGFGANCRCHNKCSYNWMTTNVGVFECSDTVSWFMLNGENKKVS